MGNEDQLEFHRPAPPVTGDTPLVPAHQRRWRRVFKAMHGFGEWLQLSVFQCRLSRRRRAELETRLRELVRNGRTMFSRSTLDRQKK